MYGNYWIPGSYKIHHGVFVDADLWISLCGTTRAWQEAESTDFDADCVLCVKKEGTPIEETFAYLIEGGSTVSKEKVNA